MKKPLKLMTFIINAVDYLRDFASSIMAVCTATDSLITLSKNFLFSLADPFLTNSEKAADLILSAIK